MADSERVAELKRKMQEKAQQAKAEAAAKEAGAAPAAAAAPAAPPSVPAPTESSDSPGNAAEAAQSQPPVAAGVAVAEAVAEESGLATGEVSATAQGAAVVTAESAAPVKAVAATNGASGANGRNGAVAMPYAPTDMRLEYELSPEEEARRTMNRREFLTYAWAGALGLVGVATGVGTFLFMYPRFRAGEFGGKFFLGPPSSMPSTDAPPVPEMAGKFWLVNTEDQGVKAIYMVCTHLGCLYKWEPSTVRFECPCHGSKFTREGFYIEGPAPRSLDQFEVTEEDGVVVVDTGAKTLGAPASESPARVMAV